MIPGGVRIFVCTAPVDLRHGFDRLAQTARDRGGVYLILCITGMLFFSVVINASMMIGLAPTTGIPLPLVSYGGSSVATTFLCIGLILGVHYRRFANA